MTGAPGRGTGWAVVLRADAAHLPLPDGSVDLIVTSPPYWGLRSYTDGGDPYDGQIGGENTPGQYLDALWACTSEWIRVFKPEGSLFVNLGDKYSQRVATRPSSHQDGLFPGRADLRKNWKRDRAAGLTRMPRDNLVGEHGIPVPEKSLIGLPWRYALGCVDRLGLILRAEIIWSKPNGLPESVRDRIRRSHEQIFHFTKRERYYAAVDEIRQAHAAVSLKRATPGRADPGLAMREGRTAAGTGMPPQTLALASMNHRLGALPGSVWEVPSQPLIVPDTIGLDHFAAFPMELPRRIILGWSPPGICVRCGQGRRPVVDKPGMPGGDNNPDSRNGSRARSTMDGGSRQWAQRMARPDQIIGYACACSPCTDHPGNGTPTQRRDYNPGGAGYHPQGTYGRHQAGEYERVGPWREYHLEAWQAPPVRPAVVLDPCGGSGTTALVASMLGRTGITVDKSADYCRLALWRTSDSGERARALGVRKPPAVPPGQDSLFDLDAS